MKRIKSFFYKLWDMALLQFILSIEYLAKPFLVFKAMFSKPLSLAVIIPSAFVVTFSKMEIALMLLANCIIFDFITGVWASYEEAVKKLLEEKGTKLKGFKQKLRFLFFDVASSEKFRLSFLKAFVYSGMILFVYFLEKLFFIKTSIDAVAIEEVTYTLITIALCCSVEIYSSIFENAKRAGFDLLEKIRNVFTFLKNVKNDIREMKE